MHARFIDWRQKAGCVTLVIALVVIGLWSRSAFVRDNLRFSIGDQDHRLASWNHEIEWTTWRRVQRGEPDPTSSHIFYANIVIALLIASTCLFLWKSGKKTD